MGGAVTNICAVELGLTTLRPGRRPGRHARRRRDRTADRALPHAQRRRAPRDRRTAAGARGGHPRRRVHRAHGALEARPGGAHRQRPRPAPRRARRALPVWSPACSRSSAGCPRYDRRCCAATSSPGIAVTALIVPKNLGYAGIAGVPLQNGLYAAAAGALIYALFCTSRQISTGPSSSLAAVAGGAVLATGLDGERGRPARRGDHARRPACCSC